jgi:hypothetical protein
MSLTKEQLQILQHSIGADQYGIPKHDRNHYCPGGDDVNVCRSLVGIGLMIEHKASSMSGGCPVFTVTRDGKSAVCNESPKPSRLTRSQRRYQAYLHSEMDLTFFEFIMWVSSDRKISRAFGI